MPNVLHSAGHPGAVRCSELTAGESSPVNLGGRAHKPLTAYSAEPVAEPLGRAFAVAMLLSESSGVDESSAAAATVLVDLIGASRRALSELVSEAPQGESGTPRGDEAETGSTDCQAVAHLVAIVAHDLVALRDMLGVADPELSLLDVGDQAAVMRSAVRMVATSGLMLDRALHLLGQPGACEDPMAWIGPHVPTLKPRAGEAA